MLFRSTTVAALPFASFPLENRRKSGVLTPYYAQTTTRGFEFGVPLYVNIAPEQDATFTPVYMSKRGVQLKSQYRYLNRDFRGDVNLEYLGNDQVKLDGRLVRQASAVRTATFICHRSPGEGLREPREGEEGGKKASQQITIDQVRGLDDFLSVGTHRAVPEEARRKPRLVRLALKTHVTRLRIPAPYPTEHPRIPFHGIASTAQPTGGG